MTQATSAAKRLGARKRNPLAPDWLEKSLGFGALVLLGALIAAVAGGRKEWSLIPLAVWLHLLTIAIVLILTPVLMWRRRGDRIHRRLGWAWATMMFATALISFGVRFNTPGQLSWIHLLSVLTVLLVPAIVLSARTHKVRVHRNFARGTVIGALLLAGFFTFPFERLLGRWLFG